MKTRLLTAAAIIAFLFIFITDSLEGVSAKYWKQDKFSDFNTGTPSQTEIKSDGKIYMAPGIKSIYKIQDREYIWDSVTDSTGNIIVAAGPKAAIYKISPAGKEIWKIALEGTEATALAIDKKDNVFAGISPDGIIYKITPAGKAEKYFGTEQKYIWSLCLDSKGNLYAGTGIKGNIFKIVSGGEGSVFAKLPDLNITSLAVNSKDELFGGTDNKGYIFKVDQTGKVFILYDSPETEIKTIVPNNDGNIYAAAIRKNMLIDKALAPIKTEKKNEKTSSDDEEDSGTKGNVSISVSTKTVSSVTGDDEDEEEMLKEYRSKLYKIDKENHVTELISTQVTTLFSIVFSADNAVLTCGGGKGRIYKIFSQDQYSLMLEVDNKHLTSMSTYKGNIYICASNEAEIYLMEDSFPEQAVFYSQVLDTANVSKFGTVKWNASTPQDTAVRLYSRSGNTEEPDDTWSGWSVPYIAADGSKIESPSARFIQWKALLISSNRKNTPSIDSVTLSYLPLNDEPRVIDLKISVKGIALKERNDSGEMDPRLEELEKTVTNGKPNSAKDNSMSRNISSAKDFYQEGALSFIWKAEDPNGDSIIFDLYYKDESDKEWKVLEKDYIKNFYTWDTKTVADGNYRIKITVSDSVDTPSNIALSSEFISESVVIDNTGPVVSKPTFEIKSSSVKVLFNAKDNLSPIVKCKYSVNGEKWQMLFPDDLINDTLKEDYTLNLKLEKKGEYTIVFQVYDMENNISTTSVTFLN